MTKKNNKSTEECLVKLSTVLKFTFQVSLKKEVKEEWNSATSRIPSAAQGPGAVTDTVSSLSMQA